MKLAIHNKQKLAVLIQLIFIYVWTSVLMETDSYKSVYIFCCMVSVICICGNYLHAENFEVLRNASARNRVITVSIIFSLAVILANYSVFTRIRNIEMIGYTRNVIINIIHCFSAFLGGMFAALQVIVFLLARTPFEIKSRTAGRDRSRLVFWGSFFAFVLINCGNLFLLEYPGNLSADSMAQIEQSYSGSYESIHPFWHTMIIQAAMTVGYAVFDDINAAVACFSVLQIAFMAGCFSYVLMTLYQLGMPKWVIVCCFGIYSLLPYNIALSITMWKDVPFSLSILLIAASLLRYFRGIGRKQWHNLLLLALGGMLMCTMRTNGLLSFGVTALLMFPFLWKNRRLLVLVMAAVLILGWFVSGPLMPSVAEEAPPDYVEQLVIPIQQIARVVVDGCPLTTEQSELLSRTVPVEIIPESYTDWLTDGMKRAIRANNASYFNGHIEEYVKLWLELGMKYPLSYIKAWVDQTKGYWNGGYEYYQYAEMIYDNDLGIQKAGGIDLLVGIKYLYFGLARFTVFFEPVNSIGLHVWLLVLCWFLNVQKRKEEFLLCIPGIVIIAGLLIGAPVFSEFRYAYPVFVTLPLIVPVTMLTTQSKMESGKVLIDSERK